MQSQKQHIRERCLRDRQRGSDNPHASRRIHDRLTGLEEYQRAGSLATYVSLPEEVQTKELILTAWRDGKAVSVPCCLGNELQLFRLHSLDELAPRTVGILEPRDELRDHEQRWEDAFRIDLFVVPGIAFDARGGRLGYGKGYYDRLLARSDPNSPKIALAFARQMVDHVPMCPNDVFMHCVITEDAVYRCTGRSR